LKGFSAVDNQGFYEKVLLKSSRGFFYCCFLLSVTHKQAHYSRVTRFVC